MHHHDTTQNDTFIYTGYTNEIVIRMIKSDLVYWLNAGFNPIFQGVKVEVQPLFQHICSLF